MALPVKTTAEDVRKAVGYFKTKPTGATVADAKSATSSSLVDGRKLSAFRAWDVLAKDGDKYKLTTRGWQLARKPETESDVFRQIIDSIKPYRSAAEWMFHQEFDSVSVVDVASNWHEHHLAALGEDPKDATIRENAVAFFHLCEAAGLGKLVLGRGGNPTRLDIDKDALKRFVEAGPSAPPWEPTAQPGEDDAEPDQQTSDEGAPNVAPEQAPVEPAPTEPVVVHTPMRAFIAHGKNMEIVEQVETVLALVDIESEVAEKEETAAIPVPEKVFEAMRRCTAGIIVVSADETHQRDGTYSINENVLIEIGAAFVLYEQRVVLVWDKRLPVPSNLQGLYRCEFEGDQLGWDAGIKLMKAIQKFKR